MGRISEKEQEAIYRNYHEINAMYLSKSIMTISWGAIAILSINISKFSNAKCLFFLTFNCFAITAIIELLSTFFNQQGSKKALDKEPDATKEYVWAERLEKFRNIIFIISFIALIFLVYTQTMNDNTKNMQHTVPQGNAPTFRGGLTPPIKDRPTPIYKNPNEQKKKG